VSVYGVERQTIVRLAFLARDAYLDRGHYYAILPPDYMTSELAYPYLKEAMRSVNGDDERLNDIGHR
jgi:hypothetical protein